MQWQIFSIVLTATQQRKMAIRTQQMYCVRNVIIGFALNVKKWDTEEIAAQQKIDDGKKKSLDELKRSDRHRQCPGCKIWIEKIAGCNHMTCKHCQVSRYKLFCWQL